MKKNKIKKKKMEPGNKFTGNKDVDMKILNILDDRELGLVCQVNKYASELCKNNLFWKNRFENNFGNIDEDVKNWEEFYKNFSRDFKRIDSYLKVESDTKNKYLGKRMEEEFYIELFNNPIILKYFIKLLNTDPKYKYLTRNFRFSSVDGLVNFIQYNRDKLDENTLNEKYQKIGQIILTNPLSYNFF